MTNRRLGFLVSVLFLGAAPVTAQFDEFSIPGDIGWQEAQQEQDGYQKSQSAIDHESRGAPRSAK